VLLKGLVPLLDGGREAIHDDSFLDFDKSAFPKVEVSLDYGFAGDVSVTTGGVVPNAELLNYEHYVHTI
jgi:hypothetical protein